MVDHVSATALTCSSSRLIDAALWHADLRNIFNQIVSDLGGDDRLSEGQRQLARRIALMSMTCESMEAKSVGGESIDLDQFGQLSDRIGRALQRLASNGCRRTSRPI